MGIVRGRNKEITKEGNIVIEVYMEVKSTAIRKIQKVNVLQLMIIKSSNALKEKLLSILKKFVYEF